MAAIHVAEAFMERERARSGNFRSTGLGLWSYSQLIAHWEHEFGGDWHVKFDNLNKTTRTTSRHINAALAVVKES